MTDWNEEVLNALSRINQVNQTNSNITDKHQRTTSESDIDCSSSHGMLELHSNEEEHEVENPIAYSSHRNLKIAGSTTTNNNSIFQNMMSKCSKNLSEIVTESNANISGQSNSHLDDTYQGIEGEDDEDMML
jgi:DNA anti-recombination protein RmuC